MKNPLNEKKLYIALTEALDDLKEFEQRPNTRVNMNTWLYDNHNVCIACLAGAVMSVRFNIRNIGEVTSPSGAEGNGQIGDKQRYILNALNDLRCGWIYSALSNFYGERKLVKMKLNPIIFESFETDTEVDDKYNDNWWDNMLTMRNYLKYLDL